MEPHQSFWLIGAEVERLSDVPVAGSEGQPVGAEGDFTCINRDHGGCYVGKRFDGQLDAKGVSCSTLGNARAAVALADLVVRAEVIGCRGVASIVTAGSSNPIVSIHRGKSTS